MYLACIHFCIPCCIPFNVYFWCVLVRTHYNEYTKTIRIPQSLCIHDSIQSVRFKYTFPIRRLKYTISIQKYTFYRVHPPSFLPFFVYLSLHSQYSFYPSHPIVYTTVAYYLYLNVYLYYISAASIHFCILHPNHSVPLVYCCIHE